MDLFASDIARALGGKKHGSYWTAKCPAHDDKHPSLSISESSDGLVLLKCHAGCSQDMVIDALRGRGLWAEGRNTSDIPNGKASTARKKWLDTSNTTNSKASTDNRVKVLKPADEADRVAIVRRIWNEAGDPRTARVDAYLAHRGLPPLTADQAGTVFRFSPHCPFGTEHVPALVARFSPIENDRDDEPTALARIRLDRFDGPGRRLSLGPAKGQAVKLSADAEVTLGLGIAEGVEKGLALLASGWAPVWATIGTSTMRTFPAITGVEALTVFCDRDEPGRDAALTCARRWRDAGKEARILQPPAPFKDWDAWWKGQAP